MGASTSATSSAYRPTCFLKYLCSASHQICKQSASTRLHPRAKLVNHTWWALKNTDAGQGKRHPAALAKDDKHKRLVCERIFRASGKETYLNMVAPSLPCQTTTKAQRSALKLLLQGLPETAHSATGHRYPVVSIERSLDADPVVSIDRSLAAQTKEDPQPTHF